MLGPLVCAEALSVLAFSNSCVGGYIACEENSFEAVL